MQMATTPTGDRTVNIQELIALAKQKENYHDAGEPPTYSNIRAVEEFLDVKLPENYWKLLESVGFMSWFGGAVYGCSRHVYWDVVRHTLISRHRSLPEGWHNLPTDCVVINTYGGGGDYVLFCKKSPRAGEVALFLDEEMGQEAASWPTLEEYLEQVL
jgi:antitoxin YobK